MFRYFILTTKGFFMVNITRYVKHNN